MSFTFKQASTVTLSVRPATPSSAALAIATVKYWIVANAVTDRTAASPCDCRPVLPAGTSGTGYYYTHWNAAVDADVRVAFLSPDQTINSTTAGSAPSTCSIRGSVCRP